MAQYEVQSPDGKTHVLEGPDNASPEQIIAAAKRLISVSPAETKPKTSYEAPPGSFAATVDQYSPLRMLGMSGQTERELAAGAARGAGSVAATLGLPQAARALGIEAPRREDMDTYLARTMSVDPESLAYKGGQIAAEISAGLPVPRMLGAVASRVPGVAAYAPAIGSAGFSPGGLTGVQNLLARVTGGAIGGGAAAGIVNPADAATGAAIGSVLSPATQVALGAGRLVSDRFIDPAIGAANALVKAGGEGLLNALQATRGMKTTPGFTPTLTERAVEGGLDPTLLAAMERRIGQLEPQVQAVYDANKARVVALKNELASIDAELARQGAAVTPEATAELNSVRNSLQRNLAAEQTKLESMAQQLTGGLPKVQQLTSGEQLAERAAALKQETRKTVVAPAYDAAFKAAGDTPVDVSGVLASAENILGKPLTAWDPSTAPPIVRALMKLAPKAEPAAPVGAGKITSRMMTAPAAFEGPATTTLENLDAIRKVINQEVTDAARGTSSLSASEARNLMELHSAIDNAIGSSATLSDDAKNLYVKALETYQTQFAPRFNSGATAKLLQPSTFNATRLLPEDAVSTFFANETNANQFVTSFGKDPQARAALATGIEDLFRKSVVSSKTSRVDSDAAAQFLQSNEAAITALERGGVSIRPRLEQVQREAAALAQGFDSLATLRTQFGGQTAQDVVTNLLKEPSLMRAGMQRMDEGARSALARETADRVLRQIDAGRPQDALKFLTDNKATASQALGGKGVYQDLVDLTEQAIQVRNAHVALGEIPSFANVEKTLDKFVPTLTPTQFDSLATVARDIARARKAGGLADIGAAAPAPKPGKLASEATEEEGVRVPNWFSNAATTARAVWAGLENKINKKVAGELTNFMYRDPDAAIAAIERARQRTETRRVFSGQVGRATVATGAQAAEQTGNALAPRQESENALAR